jgi:hypothetical protein
MINWQLNQNNIQRCNTNNISKINI